MRHPGIRRYKTRIIMALIVGGLFLGIPSAFSQGASTPADPTDVLRFGISVPAVTLAPGKSMASIVRSITRGIYETLVTRDSQGNAIPLLATSWELADDGLTWRFHLRDGVKFHDGTDLDAGDVKATFDRLLSPDYALPLSSIFKVIGSVEAVDDLTVQITTTHPTPDFLTRLSWGHAGIISAEAVEQYGADIDWTPVGTGPYMYESHVPGESVTLAAFHDYWGGEPALGGIVYRTVEEDGTRVALLETGELDVIANLPPADLARLQQRQDVAVLAEPGSRVMHIGINTGKAPFNDVRVRQALNYAIDQEGLIAGVLQGVGEPASSVISPTVWGYSAVSPYEYNPERARELLREAGYPDGFKTTIRTPQGRYYQDRATAVAVQSMLGEVGIQAEVQVVDWATYLELLRKPAAENDTELYLLGWESGTGDIGYLLDLVLNPSAFPPSGWNTMFYENPRATELMAAVGREMDSGRRVELANELQEVVVNDAPWVLLYVAQETAATNTKVQGLHLLPGEVYSVETVSLEDR